jgi:hypothetical protein
MINLLVILTFNKGELKNGYILSKEQEIKIKKYLPTLSQVILFCSITNILTIESFDQPLISNSYNRFTEKTFLSYFNEFQEDIKKISKHIEKRNTYTFLSKTSQSIIS